MKNIGLTEKEWEQIRAVLRSVTAIEEAVTIDPHDADIARKVADVNIVLYGKKLTLEHIAHAHTLLIETLPYQFNLMLCDTGNKTLHERARRHGKKILESIAQTTVATNWRKSTWGDEVSLEYGKALRDYDPNHGKYRVYGSNGPIGWTNKTLTNGPGVILGRKGAYRGVEYSKYPFFVIDTAYYVIPLKEMDMRWLYYAIKYYKLGKIDDGSPIPSTTRAAVYTKDILVPSFSEQEKISKYLGAFDDRIQLLRATNDTLEAIAQALFKSWFVDFDPVRAKAEGRQPEGMDAETAALFPATFDESGMGIIPKGWKVAPIGEYVTITGGGTPSTKNPAYWTPEEYAWTSPKDLSGISAPVLLGTEKKISSSGLAVVSSGLLPAGTLLLSSRAPIGYLAITEIPLAINQGYIAITPNSNLPPLFMYFWCKLNMEVIKGHANGSTFMEISKKAFRLIPAIIPDNSIVHACLPTIRILFERIAANEKHARTLTALRDVLLPRLISGKIRLPSFLSPNSGASA